MFRAVPGGHAQSAVRIRRFEVASGIDDQVHLEEEFLRRTPMLKSCDSATASRSQGRCRAKLVGDTLGEERVWKAFGLVPLMLLHKPKEAGNVGKQELMEPGNKFASYGTARYQTSPAKEHTEEEEQRRRGQAACNQVKHGQVSRAIGRVARATSSRTGPEIPPEVLASHPIPVDLDSFLFPKCFASAPFGSALGRRVWCICEMLKVCWEDAETFHLFCSVLPKIWEPITRTFMAATMTALLKHGDGKDVGRGNSLRPLPICPFKLGGN